jgi:hypothetical protein
MTEPDDGLIRPYGQGAPPPRRPEPRAADVAMLRPYLLTSGRVVPVDRNLEIEAQVVASEYGRVAYPHLAFEQRDIVELCHTALSVAEVAALLRYHIGVARVLIADLAASGHLVLRRPGPAPGHDLAMIERVIRGLEAIR